MTARALDAGDEARPAPDEGEPDEADPAAARQKEIVALDGGARALALDRVAREEPLEIQVQGASVAVLLRTPGDDLDLARGFLVTEGILARASDVASMRHCSSVKDPEAEDNILRVVLREGVEGPLSALRRTFASTSCGVCGKATIDATIVAAPPLPPGPEVRADVLYELPDRLRAGQRTFEATGGLHAAGLFTTAGELLLLREDVGRHNAVDKAIGAALDANVELGATLLLVSGRTSFEIVQKAAVARIPMLAGISAPSSLAVELAERVRLTLVGFLRGCTANVYAGVERIV
jgi:FdhD protein